jgi:hypothetical protein
MINLLDRYIRKNAIESIREWPLYPKHHPPESCIKVLTEQIVEPLEKWLSIEMGKGKDHISMDAGRAFMQAAYDMVVLYENNTLVGPEHIVTLNEKWADFQSEMGFDSTLKFQPFDDGSKNNRMDVLSKAMLETLKKFCKNNRRRPSAKELADYLPTDGAYIQQVEYDDWGEIVIYWKNPKDVHKITPFKAFQKRYTHILKRHPEIKKRYSKKK